MRITLFDLLKNQKERFLKHFRFRVLASIARTMLSSLDPKQIQMQLRQEMWLIQSSIKGIGSKTVQR
jgi:hypothetical protein